MRKRPSSLLWFLWLLLVVQGCAVSPVIRDTATIRLKRKRITLRLTYLSIDGKHNPLKDIFEILETEEQIDPKTGEKIDLNKPRAYWMTPLEMAIGYALGDFYNYEGNEDVHFYAAHYLLACGASPNVKKPFFEEYDEDGQGTAMHELCGFLWFKREVGIRGLALFLSYGARLDIEDQEGKRPIDIIENTNPWIPEELRKQYEEKVEPDPAQEGKEKSLDEEEKPYSPPAWTTKILPDEQKELKQKYFLDVLKELRELEKHKTLALDSRSLEYIEEKACDFIVN